jgi:hypothetical protein
LRIQPCRQLLPQSALLETTESLFSDTSKGEKKRSKLPPKGRRCEPWRWPMERDDPRFVRRANIAHYQKLLERTTDESERQRILKLLAEEKAKEPGGEANE